MAGVHDRVPRAEDRADRRVTRALTTPAPASAQCALLSESHGKTDLSSVCITVRITR